MVILCIVPTKTISRVINNCSNVSPKTRATIKSVTGAPELPTPVKLIVH